MNKPFIAPTSDMFVRYLLGSTGHEALLCDFINAHLVGADFEPVESVSIENPFNLKEFQDDKESILDVRATGKDKRIINVEIQSSREMFYVHRSLYYWARLYQGQLQEGADYAMLAPVVCINILDFIVFNTMSRPHTCFVITEKNHPGCLLTDALQIHFYEIPKYQAKLPFSNQLERWACFFQCEGDTNKEDVMEILVKDDPIFRNVHQKYIDFSADKKMRMAYEAREKKRRDEIFLLSSAERKGREEGREIGKEEGKKETLYQIVTTMQQNGMDARHIQKVTGLSLQEIEQILL